MAHARVREAKRCLLRAGHRAQHPYNGESNQRVGNAIRRVPIVRRAHHPQRGCLDSLRRRSVQLPEMCAGATNCRPGATNMRQRALSCQPTGASKDQRQPLTHSMNANINQTGSNLSLQPDALSLQPQAVTCPKCQHKRTAADQGPAWQCPNCGIAYSKATAQADGVVAHKVIKTSGAHAKPAIDRGEWETVTPGVISLSLQGRLGRLRYMAYTWPIMALSGLGMAAAVLGPLHKQAPNIPLLFLVGILWFWLWLRLMALRLHDINRSAKWLLVLWLLPAVLAAAGGGQQMIALGGGIFWIVALLLNVVPGSEGDNDYGPPPGPNTLLVKVGAVLFIAFTALAVVANVKYMQYVRSGKVHAAAPLGTPGHGQ